MPKAAAVFGVPNESGGNWTTNRVIRWLKRQYISSYSQKPSFAFLSTQLTKRKANSLYKSVIRHTTLYYMRVLLRLIKCDSWCCHPTGSGLILWTICPLFIYIKEPIYALCVCGMLKRAAHRRTLNAAKPSVFLHVSPNYPLKLRAREMIQ